MSSTKSVRSLANDVDPIIFTSKKEVDEGDVVLSSRKIRMATKERAEKDSMMGKWSVAAWLWLILIPIVIFVLLLIFAPSFVTTTQNSHVVLDHSRILLWTLILSVIVWVLVWSLNFCRNC